MRAFGLRMSCAETGEADTPCRGNALIAGEAWRATGAIRVRAGAHVTALSREILRTSRTLPIVVLTSTAGTRAVTLAEADVRGVVGARSRIYAIEDGWRTRRLSGLLPPGFGVGRGDTRIYLDGVNRPDRNADEHPLVRYDVDPVAYLMALQARYHEHVLTPLERCVELERQLKEARREADAFRALLAGHG